MWLFTPSGTMPSILARSPAIEAAIEVMGETVVAIRGRSSGWLAESEVEPHDVRARAKEIAKITIFSLIMVQIYHLTAFLQIIRNCRFIALTL